MLEQNLDNTIDKPIYYASNLMNNVEKIIHNNRKGGIGNYLCSKNI
jgi:hypothetical protein